MEEPMEIKRDDEYHDLTEFVPIRLHSGLHRVCIFSGNYLGCSHISYFGEWHEIEEAETTTDILCKSFYIISQIMHLVAYLRLSVCVSVCVSVIRGLMLITSRTQSIGF